MIPFCNFRTNCLSADIERGSRRKESDIQRHDANEGEERNPENVYNDDDDCYTISYSVPVRKGRNLPSLPKPESERKRDVKEKERGSSCSEEQEPRSATLHKIYETLDSLTSPNPAAPERPAWTLQVPDTGLCAVSPLYLMMPEAERKQTEFSITDPSANKSRAKTSVVREPGMSVTDTAKKVMEKISTNLSNKLDDGKRLCAQELETDSDSECDDVFS